MGAVGAGLEEVVAGALRLEWLSAAVVKGSGGGGGAPPEPDGRRRQLGRIEEEEEAPLLGRGGGGSTDDVWLTLWQWHDGDSEAAVRKGSLLGSSGLNGPYKRCVQCYLKLTV